MRRAAAGGLRGGCAARLHPATDSPPVVQGLELIPSENFVSASVLEAVGSVMVRPTLSLAGAALEPRRSGTWAQPD